MKNRMKKKKINRERITNRAKLSLLCLVISLLLFFTTSLSIQAAQFDDNTNISQLEQYLDNSTYSDFQKRMVLNSVQEAINDGISAEDTLFIIKNSIDNKVDPYNIKKFIDTAISAKNDGIEEKPILNKIKEGLAKNVDQRLIVNAINQKSENMKIARELLTENQIQNGDWEEMVDILADSLTNGVPPNTLSKVLIISSEQDKSWQEVEEVAQELANLGLRANEMGIANEKIEAIFNQALDNNTSIEDICMNIQDLMVAAVVRVSPNILQRDDNGREFSSSSDEFNFPSSSDGCISESSELSTPTGETGTSPVSSGPDTVGSSTGTPGGESGSSPLN